MSKPKKTYGTFVKTPKVLNDRGEIIKPTGWNKQTKYVARWVTDFEEVPISAEVHNRRANTTADIAWLITGIEHSRLAEHKGKVLELLRLNWKHCWVPSHMVKVNTAKLTDQLTDAQTSL